MENTLIKNISHESHERVSYVKTNPLDLSSYIFLWYLMNLQQGQIELPHLTLLMRNENDFQFKPFSIKLSAKSKLKRP